MLWNGRSRRYLWLVALLLAPAPGCERRSPSAAERQGPGGEATAPAAPEAAGRPPLAAARAIAVEPPGLPAHARTLAVDEAGGALELGPVRVRLEPGQLQEAAQLAIWQERLEPALLAEEPGRFEPLGEAFGVDLRGDTTVEGPIHVEVNYDPAAVPEGWGVYLLCRSEAARPAIVQGQNRLDWLDAKPIRLEWALLCGHEAGGVLSAHLVAHVARVHPDYRTYLQPVLARKFPERHLRDAEGRPWLCLYLVDPPAHEAEALLDRLAESFAAAREKAAALGFPTPAEPIVVTVRRDAGDARGRTIGNLILLRNDLDRARPYEPELLDAVVAHEYMHLVQAYAMTAPTWDEPLNDSLTEGGADWFAWAATGRAGTWQWPNASLERLRYSAAPFWIYLHERHGEGVLSDILHATRRRAFPTDASLPTDLRSARYGLFHERSYATELADQVLQREGTTLGSAYADFAASYLYRRDLTAAPLRSITPHGAWRDFAPHEFPAFEPWSVVSVTGTRPGAGVSSSTTSRLLADELSAAAFRIVSPLQRGRLNIEIGPPVVYASANLPREPGPARVHVFLYGEREGEDPRLLFSGPLPIEGRQLTIPDFGYHGEYASAALIVANTAWSKRRSAGPGHPVVETDYGALSHFRFTAHLDEHRPLRRPGQVYVHNFRGAGRRWCVSEHRSEDEDGNRCFASIMKAIQDDDVEDGDDIAVDPGTYDEAVVLTKSVTVRAKVPGTVTVRAPGSGTAITIGEPGGQVGNLILVGGRSTVPVVRITDGHEVTLAGNIIISDMEAVLASRASNVNIVNNWVASGHGGIRAHRVKGLTISGNIVAPPQGAGDEQPEAGVTIGLDQPPYQITDRGVVLRGRKAGMISNADSAIYVSDCEGVTVSENEVLSAVTFQRGISVSGSSGVAVRDNVVCAGEGIFLGQLAHAVASGNRAHGGVAGSGLRTHRCTDLTLSQNLLSGDVSALRLVDTTGVTLIRNALLGGGTAAIELNRVRNFSSFHDHIDGTGQKRGMIFGSGASHGLLARDSAAIIIRTSDLLGYHTAAQFLNCDAVLIEGSRLRHLRDAGPTNPAGAAVSLVQSTGTRLKDLVIHDSPRGVYVEGGTVAACEDLEVQGADVALAVRGADLGAKDVLYWPVSGGVLAEAREEGQVTLTGARVGLPKVKPLAVLRRLSLRDGMVVAFDADLAPAPRAASLYVGQLWQVRPAPDKTALLEVEFDLSAIQPTLPQVSHQGVKVHEFSLTNVQAPTEPHGQPGQATIRWRGQERAGFGLVVPRSP